MPVGVLSCVLLIPLGLEGRGGHSVADWNNAFAREMLLELSEVHADENFAFSPFSIISAFGMTYAGARGNTAAEMESVFRFPGQEVAHPALAKWVTVVQGKAEGEDTEFHVANRIWVQENWPVEEDFLDVLNEQYHAPAEPADFITQAEAERERINDWVFERTQERIPDLFPDGSMNQHTRFVLANALYFRGLWEHKFAGRTVEADFHVNDNETMRVAMMFGDRLPVSRVATDLAKAVALAVKDDPYSMIVVLPNEGTSLDEILAAVVEGEFPLDVNEYSPAGMHVYLPRFRVEAEIDLKKRLQALGVIDAFDPPAADFSGIYTGPQPELHLQGAYHKTFIEVHETGLEAAAATGVVGGFTSAPPVFRVDRPFLFFVTEDTTGTILFAGQVIRPEDPGLGIAGKTSGYEDWKERHFAIEDRSNPDISGPQADPLGDGVNNGLKFALGIGPMESAHDSLPRPVFKGGGEDGTVALKFARDPEAEVDLALQYSVNLSDWTDIAFSIETLETLPGSRERVQVTGELPENSGRAIFFRLRATLPE